MKKSWMGLAIVLPGLVSCVAVSEETSSGARPSDAPATETPANAKPLDGLSIELTLASESVEAGGVVKSFLDVENSSGRTVTDRACWLAAGRFAVVPADQPDAELWQVVVVDCGGPRKLHDGYVDRVRGPDFQASDMHGNPLPPGDYVAALEIEGFSTRLEQPLEIVRSP